MALKLISEEEMATKSKKTGDTKKADVIVTKKSLHIIPEENADKKDGGKVGNIEKKVIPPINPNIIVKRIYFPGDTYSKKENQKGFKSIITTYGLSWYRPMMKTYTNKDGISILSGMYTSEDKNKKVFCIYEGTNKPTTAIIKIMGSGGNFLIDITSFCHGIGCIIEDKDELFINNTLLSLQEKGEIYVEKKLEETKIEDYEKKFEERVKQLLEENIQKYLEDNKDTLERRGIDLKTAVFFKKKDIEESVRWSLAHGYYRI